MTSSPENAVVSAKRRDPEATRGAILSAAETLFVDRGFAATSMNDIARSAGVTKSLIHHHFGSKQDLWAELKRQLLAHYAEVQMDLLVSGDEDGELLQLSLKTLFGFLKDNPDFVRLSSWMDLEKDRKLADMAYPDLVRSGVERVRKEQQAGLLRSDIEPEHIIAAMVSLCSHWFRARAEFSSFYEGEIETWDTSYRSAIVKILGGGVEVGSYNEDGSAAKRNPASGGEGTLVLRQLEREYLVCKGAPGEAVAPPASGAELWNLSHTESETSLVCASGQEPIGFEVEAGWRALEVQGPLDFGLVGILAKLTQSLASVEVPVFAISTFDTDYLLVKAELLDRGIEALETAGCRVV